MGNENCPAARIGGVGIKTSLIIWYFHHLFVS